MHHKLLPILFICDEESYYADSLSFHVAWLLLGVALFCLVISIHLTFELDFQYIS